MSTQNYKISLTSAACSVIAEKYDDLRRFAEGKIRELMHQVWTLSNEAECRAAVICQLQKDLRRERREGRRVRAEVRRLRKMVAGEDSDEEWSMDGQAGTDRDMVDWEE